MATLGSKFIWSSTESDAIFSKLTRLELSMISLYNPITSFQVAGAHYQSKTPVYYIVNDIVDVAINFHGILMKKTLQYYVTTNQTAILRIITIALA